MNNEKAMGQVMQIDRSPEFRAHIGGNGVGDGRGRR